MMPFSKTDIKVDINIHGDAIGSQIIGVKLGDDRLFESKDCLLNQVLFEYLGLPTLAEAISRIDLYRAKKRNSVRVFDFAKSSTLLRLWMAVLQDRYGFAEPHTFMLDMDGPDGLRPRKEWAPDEKPLHAGAWLKLENVQLSPFVNRAPGKFFLGGWRFTRGHDFAEDDRFVISQKMWTWEDYAVSTIGIGDVRLGPIDDFTLLQASCASGSATSVSDAGGAALSPLGFPVLVEDRLYRKLKPTIDVFGAVSMESMHARLLQVGEETGLIWAPGIPKMCLIVVDRSGTSAPAAPRKAYSAIWTVASDERRSRFHYCTWGFETGVTDFRENMSKSAQIIRNAMRERELSAVFEFDHEQNWFSDDAEFGPRQIKLLSRKIMDRDDLRREIALCGIDSHAEHVVHDAMRDEGIELRGVDFKSLSRAYALFELSRFNDCLSSVEAVLSASDFNPFALHIKAMCLASTGALQEAIPIWRLALRHTRSYRLRDWIEGIFTRNNIPANGE